MDTVSCRIHRLHCGANIHRIDRNDWEDRDATHWGGISVWIDRIQTLKVTMHKTFISCMMTLINIFSMPVKFDQTNLWNENVHIHSVNSINGSDGKHSSVKSTAGSDGSCCLATVDFKSFKITWNQEINHNRELWKAQAAKGGHTGLLLFFTQTCQTSQDHQICKICACASLFKNISFIAKYNLKTAPAWICCLLTESEQKAKTEAAEDGQEQKEAEEEKGSKQAEERGGQALLKKDVEGQKEEENKMQQQAGEEQRPKKEDGDSNAGRTTGSELNDTEKKKPEGHTDHQQQQQGHNGKCNSLTWEFTK